MLPNQHIMKKLFYAFSLLTIFLFQSFTSNAQPPNGCDQKVSSKILLVGDSWGQFMWSYHAYREALKKYGFADVVELGSSTVLLGAQTGSWTKGLGKQFIRKTLTLHPEIEVVVLQLGGNDFVWDWDYGDPIEQLDASLARTNVGMDSVVDVIRSIRPDVRIVLPSYDYPNFVDPLIDLPGNPYIDSWYSFGSPTPLQANTTLQYIESKREQWSKTHTNMTYVQNLGLMQYAFGQPENTPNTSPLGYDYQILPPYAPKSVPFPYGDPRYPTPQKAMGLWGFDAYHLGPEGFAVFAGNHIKKAISEQLRDYPTESIRSEGALDGWVSSSGVTGTNDVKVGKGKDNTSYKGIFSFNTASIPDNAIIEHASIFITRKGVDGSNPLKRIFPNNALLEINEGYLNNPQVEAMDYDTEMSFSDAGCFVGQAYKNDFSTRIDLTTSALQFINTSGITQFRISYDCNTNELISYYNGLTINPDEPWTPYLDIKYSLPNAERVVQTIEVVAFPNPATGELNIRAGEEMSSVEITDVLGRAVNYTPVDKWSAQIGLEQLSSGMLAVKITFLDGTSMIKKIIKQ